MLLVVVTNRPIGLFELVMSGVMFLPVAAFCYLDGPAAYVIVGPRELVIANIFVRYSLPRSFIVSIESENLGVTVKLKDGREISIRALDPALVTATSKSDRWYRARARRLTAALQEVPPEALIEAEILKSPRYGNILFGLLAVVLFIAGVRWGLVQY